MVDGQILPPTCNIDLIEASGELANKFGAISFRPASTDEFDDPVPAFYESWVPITAQTFSQIMGSLDRLHTMEVTVFTRMSGGALTFSNYPDRIEWDTSKGVDEPLIRYALRYRQGAQVTSSVEGPARDDAVAAAVRQLNTVVSKLADDVREMRGPASNDGVVRAAVIGVLVVVFLWLFR